MSYVLTCCSTAAGPAFEGAGLSMGMRGEEGAISHVFRIDGQMRAEVIGDTVPVGICGSGVIDAASCLLESGQMDETGYLEDGDAVIAGDVKLTQQDIRMVQLAKSAVCAGMDGWMELIRDGGNIWSRLNELFSERIFIWAQYVKILAQVPLWELLFGSGYYLFEESMNVFSFAGTGIAMNRPVHNMLLNVLIGMGLLGWTGLIGWMSAMLRDLLGSASKYARLARVLLLCQIFFMLVDDSLTMVNSAVILFVVAAFAVCEEGVSLKTMDCQC